MTCTLEPTLRAYPPARHRCIICYHHAHGISYDSSLSMSGDSIGISHVGLVLISRNSRRIIDLVVLMPCILIINKSPIAQWVASFLAWDVFVGIQCDAFCHVCIEPPLCHEFMVWSSKNDTSTSSANHALKRGIRCGDNGGSLKNRSTIRCSVRRPFELMVTPAIAWHTFEAALDK